MTTAGAGKVLIVLSDADKFAIQKPDGSVSQEDTGVFLTELAKPLEQILGAGYEVVFASPSGNAVSVDPLSESLLVYFGKWWEKRKEESLLRRVDIEAGVRSPRPFSTITDEELKSFDGVFIPGGHAPISDLGNNPELGRILYHFHNEHKATAVICHGPYALLSTKYAPNSLGFAYKGYKLTSWSDAEEKLVETMKGGTVPTKVESTLKEEGAEMLTSVGKKMGGITVDREVVSGANPMAANALGTQFVQMLKAH
ncbi:ThiJ/PfpI family protein [Earliella scabrosa]|nr:ThiJ/PfpI family protein [Earliella scabrosa]